MQYNAGWEQFENRLSASSRASELRLLFLYRNLLVEVPDPSCNIHPSRVLPAFLIAHRRYKAGSWYVRYYNDIYIYI